MTLCNVDGLLIAKPSNNFDTKVFEIGAEMGCANSHSVENSMGAYPFVPIEKTVIPLTADQKQIVQETWEIIQPYKKEIGVNVYIK